MTKPNIVPNGYANDVTDFLKAKRDPTGAPRSVRGRITVPSGTAVNQYIGLLPFQKDASFVIGDKGIFVEDIGASGTTIDLGVIYNNDSLTDDPNAFATDSIAAQSGAFITLNNTPGLDLETLGDGWIVIQIKGAATDNEAQIKYNIFVSYDPQN